MKKLIALFAVMVLAGQGCPADTQTEDPTGASGTIGTESEQLEIETETQTDTTTPEAHGDEQEEFQPRDASMNEDADTNTEDEGERDGNGGIDIGLKTKTEVSNETQMNTEPGQNTETLKIDMKSGNFFFEPANITAKAGQEVEITFTENEGFHTFVIDEVGFKSQVNAGESITFTVPEEPGSYAFYCDVGNHRAAGMEGTLVVE